MRVLLPDTIYHIYNYAIEDENLFIEDSQYMFFLNKYATYLNPVVKTYAYCLMPNHFHLLIKIRQEAELQRRIVATDKAEYIIQASQLFSMLFNQYTRAYNRHYQRKGSLFHPTIKVKAIADRHELASTVHYIHQNPIHHQYCQNLNEWYWSSYHTYLNTKKTLLQKEETLQWFGGSEAFKAAHDVQKNRFFKAA